MRTSTGGWVANSLSDSRHRSASTPRARPSRRSCSSVAITGPGAAQELARLAVGAQLFALRESQDQGAATGAGGEERHAEQERGSGA